MRQQFVCQTNTQHALIIITAVTEDLNNAQLSKRENKVAANPQDPVNSNKQNNNILFNLSVYLTD